MPVHSTDSTELFNGGVEAATTLAGAGLAFLLVFTKLNWSLLGCGLMLTK